MKLYTAPLLPPGDWTVQVRVFYTPPHPKFYHGLPAIYIQFYSALHPIINMNCLRAWNMELYTDSASPTPPHWCVCTVPEYKTWNCMLIQPAPPHSTDECALSQSTKHETGYSFLPVLLLMAIDCPRATVLRFCRLPRILWPSKWMRRVTTWGYLTLIKVKSSSGILASSVSLKAVNRIFVRKKWQRVVTEMKL